MVGICLYLKPYIHKYILDIKPFSRDISKQQAVAELGQTQVIDEVVVKVRSWICRGSLSSTTSLGGWWVVGGNEINTKLNSS